MNKKMRLRDYPIGTKAHSINGGYWIKTDSGWRWCTGDTFPTPGMGDVYRYELPDTAEAGFDCEEVLCQRCNCYVCPKDSFFMKEGAEILSKG